MPRLELQAVGKTYPGETPVLALAGVSLAINQGEFVAIEGPSGSGKSTLLNLLTTIDLPTGGTYLLGDRDTVGLPEPALARLRSDTFGFIFQSFHLMPHRSVLENVELGLLYRGIPTRRRRELAIEALDRVNLGPRRDALAAKLSGGERQRAAIARATVGGAAVVVADEPTGNLDSENGTAVVRQLQSLVAGGTTVVLVTHDPEVASVAPRRVHVRDGRITADSGPSRAFVGSAADAVADSDMPREGQPSQLKTIDLLREARRAVQSRPGRSSLLITAVALATGLAVATAGLGASASSQVSSRFDVRRNRDVTITLPLSYGLIKSSPVAAMPPDFASRISAVSGVQHVGLVERRSSVQVAIPGLADPQRVDLATASEHALSALDARIRWASPHMRHLGAHTAIVGSALADSLSLGPLELGPTIHIGGTRYAIAGVLTSARRAPDLVNAVVVSPDDGSQLAQLDSAKLFLSTQAGAAPQVARQAPIALDPRQPERYEVSAPLDPKSLRADVQGDVRATLLALSVVAFLASILGIANAMLLGVLERIGEFGLRRAIGARPVHLLAQTSLEALMVGVIGGAVGLLAGLLGVLCVTIANGWIPVFDFRLIPAALIGGALVGVLGGIAASLRAGRIQAADALRR